MSGIPESQCRVCPITDSAETRSLTSTCDQRSGAPVRRTRSPLHNLQLLSTQAGACNLRAPRSIPACAGARPATVSFCHDRVRGDARAFPSPHDRVGGGRSFRGDESRQRAFHKTAAPRRGPYGADLARAVLRFQRLQCGETRRKASVHASQSREARSCDSTRGLEMEQLQAYACGEGGLIRVNCQEWPLTISYSASRSHLFENRE